MPTYDYQCRSCGYVTEVIHSMTESGPTACERCGGDLRRVLYPAGIIFKGSGFYSTDSRSANSSASAPASKDQGSTSGSGKEKDSGSGSSTKESSSPKGESSKAADTASSS